MKRVSIAYDEDDYVEWTAWAKAKGFKGPKGIDPIAVAHMFVMVKYRNVAPLTKDEQASYERYLEVERAKMKAGQIGAV